jgi:hypothetical protein
MRLPKVHQGHTIGAKLRLGLMRVFAGHAPGVVRTLLYRDNFFGKKFSQLTHQIMRGASPWSVGERELFAAFVSQLNQCVF